MTMAANVFGGHGKAGSDPPAAITHFANNDDRWDDTSDGPVRAVVRTADGTEHDAVSAWVIVGPPDFAPLIVNFVTLYDVARDAAVEQGWLRLPDRPSFTSDVYSIPSRPYGYSWVTELAVREHRKWDLHRRAGRVWPIPSASAAERQALLGALRKPGEPAGPGRMPRLNDETIKNVLPPSATQYEILTRCVADSFVNDWSHEMSSDELLPDALDRGPARAVRSSGYRSGCGPCR